MSFLEGDTAILEVTDRILESSFKINGKIPLKFSQRMILGLHCTGILPLFFVFHFWDKITACCHSESYSAHCNEVIFFTFWVSRCQCVLEPSPVCVCLCRHTSVYVCVCALCQSERCCVRHARGEWETAQFSRMVICVLPAPFHLSST